MIGTLVIIPITVAIHLAATFPIYLHLGPYTIHPHLFFESLSYIIAFCIYLALRRRFGDPVPTPLRWAVVAAAVAGAALGAKLLFFLEDPSLTLANLHNPAYFIGGKTIVGALAGGLLAVELMKRYIGLRTSTGDLYAIPLAAGIAIGRIGCFLTGLPDNTYGIPTTLPWAVDFGDGIPRHPTQLYEIVFLVALIPFLFVVLNRIQAGVPHFSPRPLRREVGILAASKMESVILSEASSQRSEEDAQSKDLYPHSKSVPQRQLAEARLQPGDAFKLFMLAYMTFRLLADFLKPYPRIFLGLGGIQWVCVLILLYYSQDVLRWLKLRPRPV